MHKIKHSRAYTLILVAFFVQIGLSLFLGPGAVRPNIMVISMTFLALFSDERFGVKAGTLCGMLLDVFSIRFFGLNTLLFALGGYIVGKYNTKFYRNSVITHFAVTFTVSLFILLPNFLFISLHNRPALPPAGLSVIFSHMVLLSSLLNSFLSIWIFAFLIRILGLHERVL